MEDTLLTLNNFEDEEKFLKSFEVIVIASCDFIVKQEANLLTTTSTAKDGMAVYKIKRPVPDRYLAKK